MSLLLRHVFAAVLVAVLGISLPLQGWAAVAMPFCKQSASPAAGEVHEHGADGQTAAHHAGHDMSDQGVEAPAIRDCADHHTNLRCNQCDLCALACAGALTSSEPHLAILGTDVPRPGDIEAAFAFITHPLLKPPRAAA